MTAPPTREEIGIAVTHIKSGSYAGDVIHVIRAPKLWPSWGSVNAFETFQAPEEIRFHWTGAALTWNGRTVWYDGVGFIEDYDPMRPVIEALVAQVDTKEILKTAKVVKI